jgi:hypothetical protein
VTSAGEPSRNSFRIYEKVVEIKSNQKRREEKRRRRMHGRAREDPFEHYLSLCIPKLSVCVLGPPSIFMEAGRTVLYDEVSEKKVSQMFWTFATSLMFNV